MRHYYAHGWNTEAGCWALYAFETGNERDAFCCVTGNEPITRADARRDFGAYFDGPREYVHYVDRFAPEHACDYGYVLTTYLV